MFDYESVMNVMRDSFESLKRSKTVSSELVFSEETVILGNNSGLDSLGFVTYISDLEERLSSQANRDVSLVLSDINDFNINNPSLTVRAIANYLVSIMKLEE